MLIELAEKALVANIAWYALLCVLFGLAGVPGKSLYFLGATILSIGVLIS